MRYSTYWPLAARRWNNMKIKSSRVKEFEHEASRIISHKSIYSEIEEKTSSEDHRFGVPWYFVGTLHMREASLDFSRYLGNGQRLDRRTTIVPRGRGPFKNFVEGALDALAIDGLSKIADWRLEKLLFWAESFNGWGYAMRGLPSPYVFGGTNIQRPGKYIADGRFSSTVWDSQPGVAPLLQTLAKLDPTIVFERES